MGFYRQLCNTGMYYISYFSFFAIPFLFFTIEQKEDAVEFIMLFSIRIYVKIISGYQNRKIASEKIIYGISLPTT